MRSTERAGVTPQYGFYGPGERVVNGLKSDSSIYQVQKQMARLVQAGRVVTFICNHLPDEHTHKVRREG